MTALDWFWWTCLFCGWLAVGVVPGSVQKVDRDA